MRKLTSKKHHALWLIALCAVLLSRAGVRFCAPTDNPQDTVQLSQAREAYQRLQYAAADSLLAGRSDFNSQVLRMKICQRRGDGVGFFKAKRRADKRRGKAGVEDLADYYITLCTYYYYQQADTLARRAIADAGALELQKHDLLWWVAYNYMLGSGGLIEDGDARRLLLTEFDHLMTAYFIARRNGYIYYEANSLQSLAALCEGKRDILRAERADDCLMLEAQHLSWADDDLPLAMANHAIFLFGECGDPFQTSCALRTRGEIYFGRERYEDALADYEAAWEYIESATETIPEWTASVAQRLSLAHAALGDKEQSDCFRNVYLDILENADQNAELAERNEELRALSARVVGLIAVSAVLLLAIVVIFALCRRRGSEAEEQETAERMAVSRHRLVAEKRANAEKRAKVSLARSLMPYIDRIGGEVRKMTRTGHIDDFSREYIAELVARIEEYNDVLTKWISIERGRLPMRLATVDLGELFGIVGKGHYAFDQKGVTLHVLPTEARVKADEALTLFMINTMADNARKFTPQGGTVTVSAHEAEDYVEVRVADTGTGFDPAATEGKGFGFGLKNCRGIIERYKKHSQIFGVCGIGVQSTPGQGSTFWFRLPRVMAALLLALAPMSMRASAQARANTCADARTYIGKRALAYAQARVNICADAQTASSAQKSTPIELYDSVYKCNLEGRYAQAMDYGEEALFALHTDTAADPRLVMGLRNEMAIAAMALRDWTAYELHNDVYTQLQKRLNQDPTLPDYCRRLERFHRHARALLVVVFCLALGVGGMLARMLLQRKRTRQSRLVAMQDALDKSRYEEQRIYVQNQILDNCLSTIKHEAMYYPARIRSLTQSMTDDDIPQLAELVDYYHHVYTILCQQAEEQVDQASLKRQTIEGAVGDEILIAELRRQITSWMGGESLVFGREDVGAFVEFSIRDPRRDLTPEQMSTLFEPAADRIPLLVAKQIIREHDTRLGNPGLRLYVQPHPQGGYEIRYTLPRRYGEV